MEVFQSALDKHVMKQTAGSWHPSCLSSSRVMLEVLAVVLSDEELVEACLKGHQDSWSELIRRYKQLVYSVIRKYDVEPEDALDIFQAVCLELFTGLPRLREAQAIPKWIITVTSHQCLRWKQLHRRQPVNRDSIAEYTDVAVELDAKRFEQQQVVRTAIDRLSR